MCCSQELGQFLKGEGTARPLPHPVVIVQPNLNKGSLQMKCLKYLY